MASSSWWFRVLLLTTLVTPQILARHIDEYWADYESEPQMYPADDAGDLISWLEGRLRREIKEEVDLVKLEKSEEAEVEAGKEGLFEALTVPKVTKGVERENQYGDSDADYMGDAPEAPYAESNQEKIMNMMGEAGNISWPLTANSSSSEDPAVVKEQREINMDVEALIRSKNARLTAIRSTILELRSGNATMNGVFPSKKTLQDIFHMNREFQPQPTSYTEKLQSFYPSCKTPNHTDEDLWADTNMMNIIFNVTYPTPSTGTCISVMAAKLRLHKKTQTNTSSSLETREHTARAPKEGKGGSSSGLVDDRLLRVSVYWYVRPLKKNRVNKRKLMDSQMFTLNGEEAWIELNIRSAVRSWHENGRSNGIVVTVEDEDGVILPASKYLHAMNCSKDAAIARPLPSFVEDAAKEYMLQQNQSAAVDGEQDTSKQSNPFPAFTYPKLDILTIEVPLLDNRQNPEPGCNLKKQAEPQPADVNKFRNSTGSGVVVNKRQGNETRGTFFEMVRVGSPSSGQNRNALVPILTKSDVVTAPEDERMRNELMRVQTEAPRLRHNRKHSSNLRNETH